MMTTMCKPLNGNRVVPYSTLLYLLIIIIIRYCKHSTFSTREHILHMPDDLHDPSLSADNFRKTLKTHLFRNALGHLAH